jgi:hypothetical protein
MWASVVSVISLIEIEAAPASPPAPVVAPMPTVALPIKVVSVALTVTVPFTSMVELSMYALVVAAITLKLIAAPNPASPPTPSAPPMAMIPELSVASTSRLPRAELSEGCVMDESWT